MTAPGAKALADAVASVPLWRSPEVAPAPAAIASPMQRGIDAEAVIVSEGGRRWLLKRYHAEMLDAIDLPTAARAARQAAAAGVGPALAHADVAAGVLVFEYLAPPWREARLGDLQAPAILAAVIDATRRFHATPPLGRTLDPFARIEAEYAAAAAAGAMLPADAGRLRAQAALIGATMAQTGGARVPCRGTGLSSDLMLDDAGGVLLLDFDHAGDGDPLYDLGILLTEACAFEAPMRAAVAVWAGQADETVLARCQLYGIADDVLWGLRMLRLAHVSSRTGVEFFKYGEWRLLRARMNLRRWSFEERLRCAA